MLLSQIFDDVDKVCRKETKELYDKEGLGTMLGDRGVLVIGIAKKSFWGITAVTEKRRGRDYGPRCIVLKTFWRDILYLTLDILC